MSEYNIHTGGLDFPLTAESLSSLDLNGTFPNYHILHEGKKYAITVLQRAGKQIVLKINGNTHTVKINDTVDQLVEQMGLNKPKEVILKDIKAPMPGLILDILVKPGQELVKGDAILILEAMKMENVIKAEGNGVVKEVLLEKGAAVEKNQVIIEMQ